MMLWKLKLKKEEKKGGTTMTDVDKLLAEINANNQKTNRKIIIILIIIILLLGAGSYIAVNHYMNKADDEKALRDAALSELELSENALGQEVAKRQAYSTTNINSFLEASGLDSLSKELQKLVKQNKKLLKDGGSATSVTTSSEIDQSTTTNITYVNNDSFPTYDTRYLDDWLDYTIIAKKDSITLDFSLINSFDVVVGTEPQGFFKPDKPFVTITNKNPYTKTTDMRTYSVKMPKPKRLGIGVSAGYGFHVGSGGVSHGLNISVGLNYNIIELK